MESVAFPETQMLMTIVGRVKEIVDCSEADIYETLKDCDFEPNEAVSRLLTQDRFQEVKRKTEKKKVGKNNGKTFRGSNNGSSRGIKSAADKYVDRGESSSMKGRLTYRKENGSVARTSNWSPVSDAPGNNKSNGPSAHSYSPKDEGPSSVKADSMTSVLQSTSVYQSSWTGVSGQISMADTVKGERVRPHSNTLNGSADSCHGDWDSSECASNNNDNICSNEDQALEIHHNGVPSFQHASTLGRWPSLEKPASGDMVSVPEYSFDSKMHSEKCTLPLDSADQHSEVAKLRDAEEDTAESSERFEHQGELGGRISVVTEDFQRLNLPEDDRELQSDEDVPWLIIPEHLQVQTSDCSHLSFGRFQPAKISTYSPGIEVSGPIVQNSSQAGPSNDGDMYSADHADIRHADVRNAYNGRLFHGNVALEERYDSYASSRPEVPVPMNKLYIPSLHYHHSSDESRSVNAAFNQNSSHMQNLALLSNLMQSRTDPVSSTLMAANAQPRRKPDPQYIPFPTTPIMSTKYGNALPASDGSAISICEALKAAEHVLQNPVTDFASGPSMGPYADMIDYSVLPQSYAYRPSAISPQYKTSGVSASSLPQPTSGHGVFGSATSTYGTSLLYDDDVLSSWYSGNRQSLAHQNVNSANWGHGYDSNEISSLVSSAAYYDDHQAQIQHLKQGQERYETPGYTYHSQNGNMLCDQQRDLVESLLRSHQGQQKQSQVWPKYY